MLTYWILSYYPDYRLPSVGEANHLLQEKANTALSMARCTHNWSSTVRLNRGREGKAGGRGLVMQ